MSPVICLPVCLSGARLSRCFSFLVSLYYLSMCLVVSGSPDALLYLIPFICFLSSPTLAHTPKQKTVKLGPGFDLSKQGGGIVTFFSLWHVCAQLSSTVSPTLSLAVPPLSPTVCLPLSPLSPLLCLPVCLPPCLPLCPPIFGSSSRVLGIGTLSPSGLPVVSHNFQLCSNCLPDVFQLSPNCILLAAQLSPSCRTDVVSQLSSTCLPDVVSQLSPRCGFLDVVSQSGCCSSATCACFLLARCTARAGRSEGDGERESPFVV